MKRLDRILAVLDPTATVQPALAKAGILARRSGAMLELFVCDFDPALADQSFFAADRMAELRRSFVHQRHEWLEQLAGELRDQGLAVETHVRWDNPIYRGIVSRVGESSPDLVVKDTHYHGLLRRTLFTNTDWNLIRTCPAPLLLAKAGDWPDSPRVLAAIDPGHPGDRPAALDHAILEWAALLAARLGGEMHAVHAFFPPALLSATATLTGLPIVSEAGVAEIVDSERRRAAGMLAGITHAHALQPERVHLEQGAAVEVLPRVAERENASVVVMGAISRSRLQEAFLGSTAERVLERIAGDVFVVKPGDFSERLPF